jgi:hypothetical protein
MNKHFKIKLVVAAWVFFLMMDGCSYNPFSIIMTDEFTGFNGSFEVVKEGMPVNWYVYKTTLDTSQTQIIYDTILPREGKQSLKLIIDSCSPVGGWHSPGIFQEMDVDTGSVYKVSCWIRNQGCSYKLRLDGFKQGCTTAPAEQKWIDFNENIDEWKNFEYTFTFSEGRDRFRFELNILSPGTLWIDDIRIEKQ